MAWQILFRRDALTVPSVWVRYVPGDSSVYMYHRNTKTVLNYSLKTKPFAQNAVSFIFYSASGLFQHQEKDGNHQHSVPLEKYFIALYFPLPRAGFWELQPTFCCMDCWPKNGHGASATQARSRGPWWGKWVAVMRRCLWTFHGLEFR